MNSLRLFFLSTAIAVSFLSCNTIDPPEKGNISINLTAEDVSCTEAWLRLTSENISFPYEAILSVDTKKINLTINQADTILYIDSLLPNKSCEIKINNIKPNGLPVQESSAFTQVTTLDTTSHNFTWQTWEFGDFGSSAIYDVAIINENDIWAVGEIYFRDSLGQIDHEAYNAAHWNGIEWEFLRIKFYKICGQQGMIAYPARSIYILNDQEMWIAMEGDQISRIHNGIQKEIICLPCSFLIKKIWGYSDKLYIVGNGGNILHYDGVSWKKIETGTTLPIQDIWGAHNKKIEKYEILCIASDQFLNIGKKVFQINNNAVEEVQLEGLPWSLRTIWFIPERKYLIGGDGFFTSNSLQKKWSQDLTIPLFYKESIRGEGYNNILLSGHIGLVCHYNGISWYNYDELIKPSIIYSIAALKNNTAICAGSNGPKAIMSIGKR